MSATDTWQHIGALALEAAKEAARKQRQLQTGLSETATIKE